MVRNVFLVKKLECVTVNSLTETRAKVLVLELVKQDYWEDHCAPLIFLYLP